MKKVILLASILFLLLSCTNNNLNNELESKQNKPDAQVTVLEEEAIDIVTVIENSLTELYDLRMTIDEFETILLANMSNDKSDDFISQLIYGPYLNIPIQIPGDKDTIWPVTISESKGLTLDEIIKKYNPTILDYNEKYFGNYELDDTQYSKVFDDGYLKYIYTLNKINIERFGKDDIREVKVIRIYTITYFEEKINITDIQEFVDFDHTKSWMYDDLESSNPSFEKQRQKFLFYDGAKVEFN